MNLKAILYIIAPKNVWFISDWFCYYLSSSYNCITSETINSKHENNIHIIICLNVFSYQPLPKTFYAIQLEQSCVNTNWFTNTYITNLKKAKRVYDYSSTNISFLKIKYNIDAVLLNLGTIPTYYIEFPILPTPNKKKIVVLYGALNNRRKRWILYFQKNQIPIIVLKPIYGYALRKMIVEYAFIIINVHYYENALLEQCRIFECSSIGMPIISETSIDMSNNPALALPNVIFTPIGDMYKMLQSIKQCLAHSPCRKNIKKEAASPAICDELKKDFAFPVP